MDDTLRRPRLILASASPRRLELLAQIGIVPDSVEKPNCDESDRKGETPRGYVTRIIEEKMAYVSPRSSRAFVLTCDTIVVCGRRILQKATTPDEAQSFLRLLSGRRHQVITGVCLRTPSEKLIKRLVTTTIQFKRLTDLEIETYIQSNEWQDKAGAYAIQGMAGRFITGLTGSYSAVVGLPLHETYMMLEGNGYFH